MKPKLKQQQIVEDWNAKYPVGTPVARYRLIRPKRERLENTHTRSEAWLMSEHSAMVFVEAVSGAISLEAVEPQAKP